MDINFQDLIPGHFNDNSRVWVYQSNRAFTSTEALQVGELLKNFTKKWKDHGSPIEGYAKLFFDHFIILIANQKPARAAGFSTNSIIKLIKNIEKDFQVELFDRLMHAFIMQESIKLVPLAALNPLIEKNFITPETLYFNNTILTKSELLSHWIIPVKESWLSKRTHDET
ncbi:MAG: hypothetical protein ABI416_08870 [Ginsengibacter sp.]